MGGGADAPQALQAGAVSEHPRRPCASRWSSWPVGDIRRSDVTAWVAELVASGASPSTVRQVHRILSLMLDVAVDDGLIAQNAATRVRMRAAGPNW